jgi:hypothetical protein
MNVHSRKPAFDLAAALILSTPIFAQNSASRPSGMPAAYHENCGYGKVCVRLGRLPRIGFADSTV